MSIFTKKKYRGFVQNDSSGVTTILSSFSESLGDISFSKQFIEDSLNRESDAKRELRGKDYDYLLASKNDAKYDTLARAEINSLKAQYSGLLRQVLPLRAKNRGELSAAYAECKLIEEDELPYYDRLEKELLGEGATK